MNWIHYKDYEILTPIKNAFNWTLILIKSNASFLMSFPEAMTGLLLVFMITSGESTISWNFLPRKSWLDQASSICSSAVEDLRRQSLVLQYVRDTVCEVPGDSPNSLLHCIEEVLTSSRNIYLMNLRLRTACKGGTERLRGELAEGEGGIGCLWRIWI